MAIPQGPNRWDGALAGLPYEKVGVGRMPPTHQGESAVYPIGYHLWVGPEQTVDLQELGRAIQTTQTQRQQHEKDRLARAADQVSAPWIPWTPRVTLIGPGVEDLAPDTARRFAILKSQDFCQAAWEGNVAEGLLRRTRAQMRLTAVSPFQTSGPIPPGSNFFFGREEELRFIEAHLRQASILIVGSRRVGKTSLLNQVRFWAQKQPDLEPIYVDLQGARSGAEFESALRLGLAKPENPPELKRLGNRAWEIEALVDEIHTHGKFPVFLLNEIDGLGETIWERWRALSDQHKARFVMVAYSTVAELGKLESPFYNWTLGTHFGGKAIAPSVLSPVAAAKLLGLLTGEELGLRWASGAERPAHDRLLDRSYRIPWVLQYFAHSLLEQLENDPTSHGVITLAHVDSLLQHEGDVVWRTIDSLDYESLGSRTSAAARRPGYQLVLYCLARQRYFLGGSRAPIRDARLIDRSPLAPDLGFTVAEARELVKATLAKLLVERENVAVGRWFDQLELDHALRLLTLTLTLEPDPRETGRYGFLMHILPRELQRRCGEKDPTLDNLIIETALSFLRLVDT